MSSNELAEYLRGCPAVETARAASVRLGGVTYHSAAVYSAEDTQHEKRIYILGERPFACKRSSRVSFVDPKGEDWYIASYSTTTDSNDRYQAEHPMFLVFHWHALNGEPIDASYNWRRIPILVID
jgi:hypothetical protein